ncbi:predicted protein [Histoplasma capsulatum var. duboisii H88]|uniref:Predicted protein n=2 Tax=Ajellomyces capsulatus TaxID=5037 RepID=F0U5Q6_AJEC8|nr:predicted protein [Histoplasma capsulatum H143]EGC41351.1 predicted protein [Histoplasma capsulatum var. duboisii H88]
MEFSNPTCTYPCNARVKSLIWLLTTVMTRPRVQDPPQLGCTPLHEHEAGVNKEKSVVGSAIHVMPDGRKICCLRPNNTSSFTQALIECKRIPDEAQRKAVTIP